MTLFFIHSGGIVMENFRLRQIAHEDFDDILDISQGIWDGADYMPLIFHKWVDDKEGYFMGVEDVSLNKIVAIGKYSIYPQKMGWLEGLRVHRDYRGKGLADMLHKYGMKHSIEDLKKGNVDKLGSCTHLTSEASKSMLLNQGFKIVQSHIMVSKPYDKGAKVNTKHFEVNRFRPTLNEFIDMPYFKNRDNMFHIDFMFMDVCPKLYEKLIDMDVFWEINGKKGFIYFKKEPCFVAIDEDIESINIFSDYLHQKNKSDFAPYTTIHPDSRDLIESLKKMGYESICDWQPDYMFFEYKTD